MFPKCPLDEKERHFSETVHFPKPVGSKKWVVFLCCLMLSDRVPLSIPGSKHLLLRRVSSQRTAAKFNFSLHLHNVSYFLYITYIIYINFIYITYIIYMHLHQRHLQVLNVYISPTKLLQCHVQRCSYTGVLAQELPHRRSYTGVLAQELLHRSSYTGVLTQELLHRSSYKGVLTHKLLRSGSYTSR